MTLEMPADPNAVARGLARAEALSPRERKAIAKRAADARWDAVNNPKATHEGVLRIGELELPCWVLENGKRVFSQGGMLAALGLSRGSNPRRRGGDRLGNFVASKGVIPFVSDELANVIRDPLRFRSSKGGVVGYAYEATALAELCDVVLRARDAKALHRQQEIIAIRCELLMRGFAKVGIIALVDEATGYQEVRHKDALQQYLEKIVRKELAAWSKRFPDEFYENIYKLRSWPWGGMQKNRYSAVAGFTNDLVYKRLAPSLLEELQAKNPVTEKGHRKAKHHQWLTEDVGHPLLSQHMHSLLLFQRLALKNGYGWVRFVRMVDQVLPRKGSTLELPLGLDVEGIA